MQSQTTSEVKKVYKLSKLPIIINCLDKNIFAMPAKSYKRDKDETAAVRQISKKKKKPCTQSGALTMLHFPLS